MLDQEPVAVLLGPNPALDVERVAEWLHRNAATRRQITCGPDSRGCRTAHRMDALDLIEYARLAGTASPASKIDPALVAVTAPTPCELPGCIVAKPHTHQLLDRIAGLRDE